MPHWPHHSDKQRVALLEEALDEALRTIITDGDALTAAYLLIDSLHKLLKLQLTVTTVAVLLEGTETMDITVGGTATASYLYSYSDGSTGTDPKGTSAGAFTESDPAVATLAGDVLTGLADGTDEIGGEVTQPDGTVLVATPATLTVAAPPVTVTGVSVQLA